MKRLFFSVTALLCVSSLHAGKTYIKEIKNKSEITVKIYKNVNDTLKHITSIAPGKTYTMERTSLGILDEKPFVISGKLVGVMKLVASQDPRGPRPQPPTPSVRGELSYTLFDRGGWKISGHGEYRNRRMREKSTFSQGHVFHNKKSKQPWSECVNIVVNNDYTLGFQDLDKSACNAFKRLRDGKKRASKKTGRKELSRKSAERMLR